ncbi:MAG: hypothetical protein HON23_06000 [Rickettsiales bacterium]|jgi:hypothetical protein|nr:hypothetical protein [Rickettsiales bacterium]
MGIGGGGAYAQDDVCGDYRPMPRPPADLSVKAARQLASAPRDDSGAAAEQAPQDRSHAEKEDSKRRDQPSSSLKS